MPQAFTLSVPAIIANVIFLLKETSVFSAISLMDLMFTAPIIVQKRKKDEVIVEALELLERIGLSAKKDNYPRQLSGGQKQRIAIFIDGGKIIEEGTPREIFDAPKSERLKRFLKTFSY